MTKHLSKAIRYIRGVWPRRLRYTVYTQPEWKRALNRSFDITKHQPTPLTKEEIWGTTREIELWQHLPTPGYIKRVTEMNRNDLRTHTRKES